jgi:hypothetical protein
MDAKKIVNVRGRQDGITTKRINPSHFLYCETNSDHDSAGTRRLRHRPCVILQLSRSAGWFGSSVVVVVVFVIAPSCPYCYILVVPLCKQ